MDHSQHVFKNYAMLLVNVGAGLIVMYLAMFAMIAGPGDYFNNINMLYMALMMAAPMGPIMMLTMRAMYPHTGVNLLLHVAFAAVFVLSFVFIRAQTFVDDRQFLRSMIPHHSGAILMCRQANLSDEALRTLCQGIIRSQAEEIAEMKALLAR